MHWKPVCFFGHASGALDRWKFLCIVGIVSIVYFKLRNKQVKVFFACQHYHPFTPNITTHIHYTHTWSHRYYGPDSLQFPGKPSGHVPPCQVMPEKHSEEEEREGKAKHKVNETTASSTHTIITNGHSKLNISSTPYGRTIILFLPSSSSPGRLQTPSPSPNNHSIIIIHHTSPPTSTTHSPGHTAAMAQTPSSSQENPLAMFLHVS